MNSEFQVNVAKQFLVSVRVFGVMRHTLVNYQIKWITTYGHTDFQRGFVRVCMGKHTHLLPTRKERLVKTN